ncbi:class I SAM-dependent methyltransferase [Niabella aquatica]
MKLIQEIFDSYDGPLIMKQNSYMDVYDYYFSKYRNKEIHFLEIGIQHGGSLKFWREVFGDKAHIYAIDINPECKQFETDRTRVFIGSQEDKTFLEKIKAEIPKLDIILDDGGHTMKQQIVSFQTLFDHVKEDGLYLCEDTHTSYWKKYGGGLGKKGTFIEFSKKHIDSLHAWFIPRKQQRIKMDDITTRVWGIHYYDSIVVYVKKIMGKPVTVNKGYETIDALKFSLYGHKRPFYKRITDFIFNRKKIYQ